jgi:hypothetical protein
VINGEQVADPELWKQARSENVITFDRGYVQETEATLLTQFHAAVNLAAGQYIQRGLPFPLINDEDIVAGRLENARIAPCRR